MRLLLLGTGGYFPNDRRHTACLLLPEIGVAFDAGTACFRISNHLETRELDIFLTHAHLDHIFGLTTLLPAMMQADLEAVRVHASPPVLKAVREHLFAESLFPVVPEFELRQLADEVVVGGNGLLTHIPLPTHPGGSTGFKIVWADRSLAYITDTTIDGSYVDFIRGVDVLIHECYFPDEQADWAEQTGHSHTTPVARLARDAGVGRLVLVHPDPLGDADDPIGLETARSIFSATEQGVDGQEIEF
jgi:ribonuclease BN (tRNA processing enzyme)